MPMFTSLRRMERRICRLLSNLCIRWERIANEILMHFRAQRKSAGDVSLSDYIETGKEGNALSLMDVVCTEEDLFEDLETRQTYLRLHRYLRSELTSREQKILILRYGLGGKPPLTQRETAQLCRISRSYVSRIEKRALEKLQAAFSREMQENKVCPPCDDARRSRGGQNRAA